MTETVNSLKAVYEAAKALAEAEGATDAQKAEAETLKGALDNAQKQLDEAKPELEKALTAAKSAYAEFIEASENYLDVLSKAKETCAWIKENFGLLEENDAYTAEIRAELKAMLDELETQIPNCEAATNELKTMLATLEGTFTEHYPELLPEKKDDDVTEEPVAPDVTVDADDYNKYVAAETTIVYEQFSNGTAFILNFNNFAVKVEIDGVYYTVAAYGYLELK
jgi:chromosome segregation ATPase